VRFCADGGSVRTIGCEQRGNVGGTVWRGLGPSLVHRTAIKPRASSLVESRRVSSSRVVQVPCTGSLYESRIVRAAEPSVQERVCSILSCIRSLERQAHLAPLPLKAQSGQRGQGNIQCHLSVDVEGNVRKPMDLNPITKPHNDHSLSKTPFLTCTYHRRS